MKASIDFQHAAKEFPSTTGPSSGISRMPPKFSAHFLNSSLAHVVNIKRASHTNIRNSLPFQISPYHTQPSFFHIFGRHETFIQKGEGAAPGRQYPFSRDKNRTMKFWKIQRGGIICPPSDIDQCLLVHVIQRFSSYKFRISNWELPDPTSPFSFQITYDTISSLR